jgi:fatty acid omega-hydroxylase
MGRSEKIWKDAHLFKPERWLEGKTYSQYEYPAFNAGPRICLGKTLAELQGVLVLSTITKHFRFEQIDHSSIKQKLSLTLPLLNGFKVYVSKRM